MTENLLAPEELAARWQMSVGSLANQRHQGRGPTYIKLGGAVRYRLSDIEEYEKSNRQGGER